MRRLAIPGWLRGAETASRPRKLIFLAAAILLGIALEWPAIEILPGSYFSLGMVPVLVVTASLGPLPGLVVLMAAKSFTIARIGNGFALLIYGLEVLAIAFLRRRRPQASLLALDGLYWPVLGLPLFYVVYRLCLGVTPETVVLVVLKVWLASLFNACIAGLIIDSSLIDRVLGRFPKKRAGIEFYIKSRISLILLPVAFISLVWVARGFHSREEDEMLGRVESGLVEARLFLENAASRSGSGASGGWEELLADLNGALTAIDSRYELVAAGESSLLPDTDPWRNGLFVRRPMRAAHPMDCWRASEYYGLVGNGSISLRYVVRFEPSYLRLFRVYATALSVVLFMIYGAYGIVFMVARSLSRKMELLIASARSLPERIEGGELPSWPDSGIGELAAISGEFQEVSRKLRSLFDELSFSRDRLESAVRERTAELEQRGEEIRLLLVKIESERESERIRIARELHDEFGQDIASLGMALYLLERHIPREEPKVADKIGDMRELLSRLSDNMHRLIADLRPSVLDRLGLPEALQHLASEQAVLSGMEIRTLVEPGEGLVLGEALKTTAYRIVQEALSNAIRHSGGSTVTVSLRLEGDSMVVEVEDDGRGFDASTEHRAAAPSFGILGMRERCRAMGGFLHVASSARDGTLVRATLPLSAKGAM
jgi:signal transduction histidine kinase